jgi:hypothetical protein
MYVIVLGTHVKAAEKNLVQATRTATILAKRHHMDAHIYQKKTMIRAKDKVLQ